MPGASGPGWRGSRTLSGASIELRLFPEVEFATGLVVTTWLIDKSALVRLAHSPEADQWAGRIERGLVRICTVTRLEVGFSARPGKDVRAAHGRPPLARMPIEYLTPAIEDRAVEVQVALGERGQHRAATIPDLLIAATAELAQLTVLHDDKHFEFIASVTEQPIERLTLNQASEKLTGVGRT